jgi:exosortase
MALTAVLLLVCYASTLGGMIRQWSTDEDMGHGFLVPVVISWIVWRERRRWRELDSEPSLWGFALLAAGAGLHAAGAIGAGLFASSLGLLLSIAGVVLGFGGFALVRAWTFPLLLTLFMLPKLAIVYNQATLPLQLLASRLAAAILTTSGLGVIREGNILDVGGHRVAVAEACNGIRFLLPLGFLAVIFAYLSDPKPWMRLAVLAAAVPVAIAANAVRVAAAARLPALDSGLPHEAEGAIIFVISLAMIPILQRLFNFMYARAKAQRREYA